MNGVVTVLKSSYDDFVMKTDGRLVDSGRNWGQYFLRAYHTARKGSEDSNLGHSRIKMDTYHISALVIYPVGVRRAGSTGPLAGLLLEVLPCA